MTRAGESGPGRAGQGPDRVGDGEWVDLALAAAGALLAPEQEATYRRLLARRLRDRTPGAGRPPARPAQRPRR